jgi:hypothetical protein
MLQHRKANIRFFVSFGFIYRNEAWSGNIFDLHCLQPIHRNGMHQIINVVLICSWVSHFRPVMVFAQLPSQFPTGNSRLLTTAGN